MDTRPRVPQLHLSVDLGDLLGDLEAVEVGLGRVLRKALRDAIGPVAVRTRELMPEGPGPHGDKDKLPHIRDTLVVSTAGGTVATLASAHPGAPVLNFGGTIAPRGHEIEFPHRYYAQQAGEEKLPAAERQLQDAIDAMATTYLN